MLELYQEPLSKIPVPRISADTTSDVATIEQLVDVILELKAKNGDADIKDIEARIDIAVYRLYGLSPNEILLLQISTLSSEQ
jgi:hypothetical protein